MTVIYVHSVSFLRMGDNFLTFFNVSLFPLLSLFRLRVAVKGARKPHHDGDLRRNRSGGETGLFVYCHDLHRSHAINEETKKKDG